MKTQTHVLILLATCLTSAHAGKLVAPTQKLPAAARSAARIPNTFYNLPAAAAPNKPATARPATPRFAAPGARNTPRLPSPSAALPQKAPARIPEGLNRSGPRELGLGNVVRELGPIQNMIPGGVRESFGMQFHTPNQSGRPNLDISGGGSYTPRAPRNPLDRSSRPGAGLTDIRGTAANSRQSQESDVRRSRGRDMSPTGRGLLSGGTSSDARTDVYRQDHADGSYDLVGYRSTDRNEHSNYGSSYSVREQHDSSGRVTGYITEQFTSRANGDSTREVVHRDANGDAQDVVRVEHNASTNQDTKTVYNPDGSVRSVTQGCGIDPNDGGALGGPIGPRVGEVAGLMPLDLLRQHADDQPSGGSNFLTSGGNNGRQVRPGSEPTSSGGPSQSRINISTNPEATDRLGNNIIGGGDRPN